MAVEAATGEEEAEAGAAGPSRSAASASRCAPVGQHSGEAERALRFLSLAGERVRVGYGQVLSVKVCCADVGSYMRYRVRGGARYVDGAQALRP